MSTRRPPHTRDSGPADAAAERLAYSVDEAARLTGLSRDLLYDEMRRGILAYIKVGRRRADHPPAPPAVPGDRLLMRNLAPARGARRARRGCRPASSMMIKRTRCGHTEVWERVMTSTTLQQVLACVHCGSPVFPACRPEKTRHRSRLLDATTDRLALTGSAAIARASQPPRDINRHHERADRSQTWRQLTDQQDKAPRSAPPPHHQAAACRVPNPRNAA